MENYGETYIFGFDDKSRSRSLEKETNAKRKSLEFADFYLLVKWRHSNWGFGDVDIWNIFKKYDGDGDGAITPSEYRAMVRETTEAMAKKNCQRPYQNSSLKKLKGIQWWRQFLWIILDEFEYSSVAKSAQILIMSLVIISTLSLILETAQSLRGRWEFGIMEWIVSLVFTIEWVVRFVCCRSRRIFIFKPLNIVDFLSFLPLFIKLTGQVHLVKCVDILRSVRSIRLIGMIRMLKINFFADYMLIFSETLKFSKHSFGMLGFLIIFPIIIFGSFLYAVENKPGSQIATIWDAIYFVIVTFTTLGYGDNYPRSVFGKIIACVTVLVGIVYLTFAIQIIGNCFDQAYGNHLERMEIRKYTTAKRLAKKEAARRPTVSVDKWASSNSERDSKTSHYSIERDSNHNSDGANISNRSSDGSLYILASLKGKYSDESLKGSEKDNQSDRRSSKGSEILEEVLDVIGRQHTDADVESNADSISTQSFSDQDEDLRERDLTSEKLPDNISKLASVTNELTSILHLLKAEQLPEAEASTLFLAKFSEMGKLLSK